MYLCYDAAKVYIFVGRAADPFGVMHQLFKTNNFNEIEIGTTEEEVFSNVAESSYLTNLYNIIN